MRGARGAGGALSNEVVVDGLDGGRDAVVRADRTSVLSLDRIGGCGVT
jgi:hypothetical protein